MELDNGKKRVRAEACERENNRLKKSKEGEEEEEERAAGGNGGSDTVVVPTEEEVEEFFAILRRIRVAVKYFDEKGRGGKEWREELEQTKVAVDDGENDADGDRGHREEGGAAVKKNKGVEEVIINEGFDLNAVAPEAVDGDAGW